MSRVVERLFLTVPRGCLQFVIVVFPDHTHLLFLRYDFCKCGVILGHCYVYTKHILNSTIIANIKVCSIQMQCVIEALMCIFKTF